jgi:hypothetical protein
MTRTRISPGSDRGAALVSALMIVVLMAAVTATITVMVISDTQMRALDNRRAQAFYVAHAGLEQLTAKLGNLFLTDVSPTTAEVNAIATTPPALGATWLEADGSNGYRIDFPVDGAGSPLASTMTVSSGAFQGLVGLATPYRMTATARLADRSEASLTRTLQTVAIPVFQFGIFSETELSFFAGPDFGFGGRVHCNGNLFLCHYSGNQLTLTDRVTAVGEVIRTHMSNGYAVGSGLTGDVRVITQPGSFRNLLVTEGSLVGTLGSAQNEPTWYNRSTGDYNYNIMNGRTGARRLDLPITQAGATPIDLIKRPAVNENTTAPNVLSDRFYSLASLRILLSDTAAEITNLPGIVTATPPVSLGTVVAGAVVEPAGYTVPGVTPNFHAHLAQTPPTTTTGVKVPVNTPLLGGFLKIEKQNAAGVWSDVTIEILNLGITSPAYQNANTNPTMCADDFNPNAVLRLQRELDEAGGCYSTAELTTDALASSRFVPNVLFDPREGTIRDNDPNQMQFSGIIHYIEIDARNLSRWFTGAIGTTGTQSVNVNGFTVYFSDRRGNKNDLNVETGEFGYEDNVNPNSSSGAPNGSTVPLPEVGEDLNGNNILDRYGRIARLPSGLVGGWGAVSSPFSSSATPENQLNGNLTEGVVMARRNPLFFFRRALKLTNGALGNLVAPGLTIASENAVYIQGNWNANSSGFGNPHVATAVLADSVTMLSNAWNDLNSLTYPYDPDSGHRAAATTWYRVALIAGKGLSFPRPSGSDMYYGTDGGVHNFLRYIEDWTNDTLNYRGSLVSLYTSRQAVGIYKCCEVVYHPPERAYSFDTDFLTPALLPPRTPMFRDVNTTGFAQLIRTQ